MEDIGSIIARNIKRLRNDRGLNQVQLAEAAGVSKVVISQLEKGDSNPTINTLWKVASGLHVPYSALMEDSGMATQVVRAPNTPTHEDEDGHYRLNCIFPTTPHRDFEIFMDELDAGVSHVTEGHPVDSNEYVYVIQGSLRMEVGSDTYDLAVGDAISFDASQQHVYSNLGDTTVKMMVINHYFS